MKDMIREIILDSLNSRELKAAIKAEIEMQLNDILDYEAIARELLEEFDLSELTIEAAAEMLLPF